MRKIGLWEIVSSSGTAGLKFLKLCDYIFGSMAVRIFPAQQPRELPADIARILVIRPGGIGDAVFLLPIFKAFKLKHPQARLDVLCQKRNAPVFRGQNHLVDRVFVYDSWHDLSNFLKNTYDIVVDTEQWHYLTALTAWMIKSRMKIGFASRPLRRKFFNLTVNYDSEAYELDNFSSLFEGLIEIQKQKGNIDDCFFIPEALKTWAEFQIPANSVAVSIGASVPERRLSVEQMVILAKGLLRLGFHPVFLGGRDMLSQNRRMMDELDGSQVYNFVGKISLHESAALIKKSRVFIGTDSGLMHLACAVGSPVIALFGAGNMKKWMRATAGRIGLTENVPCSPCTSFGYGLPVCRGSFHCIRSMGLDSVLEKYLPHNFDSRFRGNDS